MNFLQIEQMAVRHEQDGVPSAGRGKAVRAKVGRGTLSGLVQHEAIPNPRIAVLNVLVDVPIETILKALGEGGSSADIICAALGVDLESARAGMENLTRTKQG